MAQMDFQERVMLGQLGQQRSPRLGDRMLANALAPRPVYSTGGALAQGLSGALSGLMMNMDDRDEEAKQKRAIERAGEFDQQRRQRNMEEAQTFFQGMGLGGGFAPAAQPSAMPAPVSSEALPATNAAAPPPQAADIPENMRPMFERVSAETGVPLPVLAAQVRQESNFNPQARGRSGEIGLAQIMPATARQPGFGMQGVDPNTLNDPEANLRFGAQYLAARARHNGLTDWNNPDHLASALRSYNGGGDPNYVANVTRFMPQGSPQGSAAGMAIPASAGGGRPDATPAQPDWLRIALQASAFPNNPTIGRVGQIAGTMAAREQRNFPIQRMVGPEGPGVYEIRPDGPRRLGGDPEGAPLTGQAFDQRLQLAQASRPQVSVDTRAETSEAQGRGRALAEEEDRTRLAAEIGAGVIDNIRQVRAIGAETGRLAPARELLGGWFDALGVNSRFVKEASDLQAFNAAASSVVLGRQLEQKGVQTEGDAQRMRDTFAGIRNTMDANDFIMRAAEAQALRAMERASFYQNWRQEPGPEGRPRGTVDGAGAAWNAYIRQTPMVARSEGGVTFLHEWLPVAEQRLGSREAALDLWRQQAGARR